MGIQRPNGAEIQQMLKDYLLGNADSKASQDLGPDDNLLEAGVLDSLGIAEVTEYMEKTFAIQIDEEEITARNYRSLNTLTALCLSKLGDGASR